MSINVIEQNTQERRAETERLFHQLKPLLDQGYGLWTATIMVTGRTSINSKSAWYRDLKEQCRTAGYDPNRKGKRRKR